MSVKIQEEICTIEVRNSDFPTMTFKHIFNQTSCNCEVDARLLLTEMNSSLTSNNFQPWREEQVVNHFYKLLKSDHTIDQ